MGEVPRGLSKELLGDASKKPSHDGENHRPEVGDTVKTRSIHDVDGSVNSDSGGDPADPLVSRCSNTVIRLLFLELHAVTNNSESNQQLWHARKKWTITVLVCIDYFMFTWITTAVVSSRVTASLQEKFDATYVQIAQYSVAIPALALAVSPLFWTPLAKTYGRRPVMIVGVTIAFVSCIGAAVATSYGGYMAARFFQGWGVGPASTVGLQVGVLY